MNFKSYLLKKIKSVGIGLASSLIIYIASFVFNVLYRRSF
ncbi:triple gene block 3-like protein [Ribes americanum virus A]|uniref:Triple gene block 3-like protein n=1 Tax=Ribes americanum virus A TaxID=1569057 RepID=A0A345F6V1_9VIRU|nr:triple gene block 3-like protein [Ribes americanum virus A]AXG24092.1 triple gene block 3-like protein [Ribes americanum virus A]